MSPQIVLLALMQLHLLSIFKLKMKGFLFNFHPCRCWIEGMQSYYLFLVGGGGEKIWPNSLHSHIINISILRLLLILLLLVGGQFVGPYSFSYVTLLNRITQNMIYFLKNDTKRHFAVFYS